MTQFYKRTWMEVDLDLLRHNVTVVQSHLPEGLLFIAVIKCDAYGQGAVKIGRCLYDAGIRYFAVACLAEAVQLRQAGIGGEILVLAYTAPEFIDVLLENDLTQTIIDPRHAAAMNEAAERAGHPLKCHMKLETGMNRIGFRHETPALFESMASAFGHSHLHFTGIFSHFSSADEDGPGQDYTVEQIKQFEAVTDALSARGIDVGIRHLCNSPGVQGHPEAYFDMVRCGSLLSGFSIAPCIEPWALKPISSIKTIVMSVRHIPAGSPIGYGRTFVTPKGMDVATVAIGYGDGYPRALSRKGRMMIRGQWAPVLGSVCMDQTMLNVTDIPDVKAGDVATIIGTDGPLSQSAFDLADQCGTAFIEIISRFSPRVQRLYFEGGQHVETK